jgi:hypothetical protein
MQKQPIERAARIGNGTKLHPAFRDENRNLFFRCSCPNTMNGFGMNRATFFPGKTGNCGQRGK